MKITELVGRPHVFTLKDGGSFRILARETKNISESNISDEVRIAENEGLIVLTKDFKEVPKNNKKSGGTK